MATTAFDLGDRDLLYSRARDTLRPRLVDWREFDTPQAIAAWDKLAAGAAESNPFFESWYLLPSLRAFAADGAVQLLVVESNGELVGLMPVLRSHNYAGWPFPHLGTWLHANCFLGVPLVIAGCEGAFWRAVTGYADAEPGLALFFHLQGITLGGPLHAALERVCADEGRPCGVVANDDRPLLRTNLGPEAYRVATLSKKKRRELRRQRERLEQMGAVEFAWYEGEESIEHWIKHFLHIEALGWKGEQRSALTCSDDTRSLFTEALREGARRGRLVRFSLLLDGRPIAMLVNFLAKPASFGFKTAFDPDFARFSPGVLLEYEYLETLARDDIAWCDSCAASDHPVMSKLWTARRPIGRLSVGIGGRARRSLFRGLLALELSRNPEGSRP